MVLVLATSPLLLYIGSPLDSSAAGGSAGGTTPESGSQHFHVEPSSYR